MRRKDSIVLEVRDSGWTIERIPAEVGTAPRVFNGVIPATIREPGGFWGCETAGQSATDARGHTIHKQPKAGSWLPPSQT
jgi:hypothetical protein